MLRSHLDTKAEGVLRDYIQGLALGLALGLLVARALTAPSGAWVAFSVACIAILAFSIALDVIVRVRKNRKH